MLQALGLSYQYSEKSLFSNLSFEINPGDCLQIIGGNGAGKTTLLRILSGLCPPQKGKVYWQHQDIYHSQLHTYNTDRLYLGHKLGIKTDLTLFENLKLHQTLQRSEHPVSPTELTWLQLKNIATKSLSAGEQKKLALLRLLSSSALIWILDEPFSNLDETGTNWVQELIKQHLAKKGRLIFTSHQKVNLTSQLIEL
ncbi:MAG: hypothetical protein ACD_44C00049G0019 [uncultured bacterium]|nr:MAG: hypothetical protein ACD_44C00049G0019 [uncultured bacterium]OGT16277.1 MAG: heme ABC exporter, ATP-binding protein CcmA [Gammaproteobacteria bacterium RIFCSPHIGHO2_02_FULL_38_33]OGT24822.1 MAG: heme ABC exporter, ATP-binding protein CcmA [Gammaproteobacteria bacterium RIFCSPHIGHO2_12_38_15]OGT68595.1 MAG: heme ABC exporter, ATP-binding protein CcmA [Gammaproteobacteria bacterium RIFCSPLOWO2_02_FULL_38_11]OGT75397.1 MAG: heme ABC exporter, ATP-binding protein CcmA [Gammaproteobacteria b